MLDAIPMMTLAAGAAFAWIMCALNRRVFIVWRLVAVLAPIPLIGYVVFALMGDGSRMVLWSGLQMDRALVFLSVAPVFVWPMELKFLRLLRAERNGGISAT
jgi:hypothetical protein